MTNQNGDENRQHEIEDDDDGGEEDLLEFWAEGRERTNLSLLALPLSVLKGEEGGVPLAPTLEAPAAKGKKEEEETKRGK